MSLFISEHGRLRNRLGTAIHQHRLAMAKALYAAVRQEACASWKVPQPYEQVSEWGRAHLSTTIDLLTAWFKTLDPLYRDLFAGWVHSRLVPDLSDEPAPSDYKPAAAIKLVKPGWLEILKPHVPADAMDILESDLALVAEMLSAPALRQPRILFIGDCIQWEVMTALLGPCAEARISFKPILINERIQPALRNRIRTMPGGDFDLVFFSPFSHAYLPEYETLLKSRRFWPASELQQHVDAMLREVYLTIDALAAQFHCPVYVHNTAGAVQSFRRVSGMAKHLVSQHTRGRARTIINGALAGHLNQPHLAGRVRLLDENSLRGQKSDLELGRVYIDSHAYHPTRLSVELGRNLYFEAIFTTTFLATKKVVVCDLDNTLWDGVIGEGSVAHYADRQTILKGLRHKGVLLSINSKNDPKNVRWSGAVLQPEDFVAPRINWEPKVANMASIRDALNLKMKDFVFLDDRPDELERMQNAFPEIVVLNATQPATWKVLAHWQQGLRSDLEEDRTRLYHEKTKREQFLNGFTQAATAVENEAEAFAKLQLSVKIEEAGRSGIKRAAELINRTNQFNLCGSRTSVHELETGLGVHHWVLTAAASDKFGSMGVVGVMRVDRKPGRLEIPIFVLSCRVFGFGIEYALLNAVKNLATPDYEIVGHYKETQSNEPCRRLYPVSGMIWDGAAWIGKVGDLAPEPAWLKVENRIPQLLSSEAHS